ncbi:MAG: lysylphosphatidylglycerol synthase domain-containing protein [Vicinamibacterales bacterium]
MSSSLHRLLYAAGLVLLALALWVLIRQVGEIGAGNVLAALRSERPDTVGLAAALVALNYFVLTFHDQLAVRYIGRRLSWWRVGATSFLGFAVSNSVGFGVFSGATVRFRFYSRWKVSGGEISRIVAFYSSSTVLGLAVISGCSLAFDPPTALTTLVPDLALRLLGAALLTGVGAYLLVCVVRREPLRLWRFTLSLPSPGMSVGQVLISSVDWVLCASILYVLLPSPRPPFFELAGAFAGAQLAGIVSHVPGSLGVFESLMVLSLRGAVDATRLLQALLLFRVLYYVVPFAIALAVIVIDGTFRRRTRRPALAG